MAEERAATSPASAWRFPLTWFILSLLAVRAAHLALLSTTLTGMNPKIGAEAKAVVSEGLGRAFIDVPPASVLALAGAAWAWDMPPGRIMPAFVLGAHLLLGAGFLSWVRSLRLAPVLETGSLVVFLWLPLFNSYEGFDNFPVTAAAAGFFAAIALYRHLALTPGRIWEWLLLAVVAWLIVPFRAEYILFAPLYFVLEAAFQTVAGERVTRRRLCAAAVVCLGVGAGAISVIAFHGAESGHYELAPREYRAWTFLDGTPAAWLQPEDDSEVRRVARGIERFGHPAEYDYSVFRMMLHNPLDTAAKFSLNVPRWLYQLGRRHVAAPLPIAMLAVASVLARWFRMAPRVNEDSVLPPVAATILMTLPLCLLIPYAEYMTPAFGALCILVADGLLLLFARLTSRMARSQAASAYWIALTVLCLAMEFLLFRGGGALSDAQDHRELARWLERQTVDSRGAEPVLLDPYSYIVDCNTRARVVNRVVYHLEGRREYGFNPLTPVAAAETPAADFLGVRTAAVWPGEEDTPIQSLPQRLDAWSAAGYRVERVERFQVAGEAVTWHLLRAAP